MTKTGFYWLALALLPVAILGYAAYLRTRSTDELTAPMTSAHIANNDLLKYPAYVETSAGTARLSSLKVGQIKSVLAAENSSVKAGEVIVQLDSRGAKNAIRSAKLNLQIARSQLENAQRDAKAFPLRIEQEKKQLESLRAAVEQAKLLKGISDKRLRLREVPIEEARVADTKLAQAKTAVEQQQIRLKELESINQNLQVQLRETELQQAEVTLEQAELELERDAIRAPADGRIVQLLAKVGELAGPTVPSVVFQPDSNLVIRIDVEQVHIDQVRVGLDVAVRDYHRDELKWSGHIERVATEFVPADRRSQTTEFSDLRVVECLVVLDGDTGLLRVGQKVWVEIQPAIQPTQGEQHPPTSMDQ